MWCWGLPCVLQSHPVPVRSLLSFARDKRCCLLQGLDLSAAAPCLSWTGKAGGVVRKRMKGGGWRSVKNSIRIEERAVGH